jgi:glutathione synthase/RimK-type ligase-like ATP-grasp enzyme
MNDSLKIAIHHRPGSFSDYWIRWCQSHAIPFKLVDAYGTQIVKDLEDCDGFLWHWSQDSYADQLFARQLTLALEGSGKKMLPDAATAWHFDDKLGQKYLFEVAGIPHIPTFVFYSKSSALEWLSRASFPLVFKLRGGAGSMNVQFVPNIAAAKQLVNRAFGKGFPAFDVRAYSRQAYWEFRRDRKPRQLLRAVYYFVRAKLGWKPSLLRYRDNQQGYVYFQNFVPNNAFDDRMVVIGNRCFCLRRKCRKDDFRASGSGLFQHEHTLFPRASIALAFDIAKKLKTQAIALDFVYDQNDQPLLMEISFGFATGAAYENCDGYFNDRLEWIDERVRPQDFMMEDFINSLNQAQQLNLDR